jgi:hypothetical protein
MLRRVNGLETVFALVVIGGHSVAAALIEKQIKQAIYQSLGVAAIAVVFIAVHALIDFVQRKSDEARNE